MLAAIFICLFCECVLPTNGRLTYKIYRSAHNPNDLKLKIGGSIRLGDELPQPRAENPNAYTESEENTLILRSKKKVTDKPRTIEDGAHTMAYKEPNRGGYTAQEEDSIDRIDPEDDSIQDVTDGIDKSVQEDAVDNLDTDEDYDADDLDTDDNSVQETNDTDKIGRNDKKKTKIAQESIEDNKEVKGKENDTSTDEELADLRDQFLSLVSEAGVRFTTDKPVDRKGETGKDTPELEKASDIYDLFPYDSGLRIGQSTERGFTKMFQKKHIHHKVENDDKVRKFTEHIFRQTMKAFKQMKQNSDPETQKHIDSLAETYRKKFTEFVLKTRQTDIRTSRGSQTVMLHTLDTSNLILDRVMNLLKSDDTNVPRTLREGGAAKMYKEVDNVKATEYQYACKKFGVCRSSQGFRTVLQDVISIILQLPDHKLLEVNDAATEVLKNSDLSTFADSPTTLYLLNRAIKTQERKDPHTMRNDLKILYSVLSRSHLPLIIEKGAFAKPAVKRTVDFRKLLDAVEAALPPIERNKREWVVVKDRLKRWKDDSPLDIQEILQQFFDNIQKGVAKNFKIKPLVEDIAESNTSLGAWF